MYKNNIIIKLKDISYSYPNSKPVIDKLNFHFYKNSRLGLMGSNGCGKTTLFHLLVGLIKPASGNIEIFGKPAVKEKDFKNIRRKIGFLFQDADDQLFSPTVIEDVAFGPLNLGKSPDEALKAAKKTLEFLGLAGFEKRITHKLSGGEKKLVSLATILSMEPEVLLLDEPTAGLDDTTKERIIKILSELNLSLIIISHEIDFLYEITDSIVTMKEGRIVSDTKSSIHRHVHVHPHGSSIHKHK